MNKEAREYFEKSFKRPHNYLELSLTEQWKIDENIGLPASWWPFWGLNSEDQDRLQAHYGINQGPLEATYDSELPEYGDLMTLKDWLQCCEDGLFVDYDGHGNPSNGTLRDNRIHIKPSRLKEIPLDCTHILWFNR